MPNKLSGPQSINQYSSNASAVLPSYGPTNVYTYFSEEMIEVLTQVYFYKSAIIIHSLG